MPGADREPRDRLDPDTYHFRGLPPRIHVGTASDRYAGWLGQIYSPERFGGRAKARRKRVGGKTFTEEVLPVESVEEYFEHFNVLEIDFTFYRPLLDADGEPTPNYHVLRTYRAHLRPGDRLLLKAPQAVCARKIRRTGRFVPNPDYLDAQRFTEGFYRPAAALLGDHLGGILFEQEYQKKDERQAAEAVAADWDRFFAALPSDPRYHLELRTEAYLKAPLFDVLAARGVGQVLSHWTWLPPLAGQFRMAGESFHNAGGDLVIRLMTPPKVRYEQAYAMAHPFDRLVHGMLDPRMVEEAAHLMRVAVDRRVRTHTIANNRAGGNAPEIARAVVEAFLGA